MVIIEEAKRIDWMELRAEFIAGASFGTLSKKYHLSKSTIYQHAKADGWQTLRTNAANEARTKTIQKVAEAAADNAALAESIKHKLLMRLKRTEERFPGDATEIRISEKGRTVIFRLRDLTAAYKDLTDDLPKSAQDSNGPIMELLRRLDDECGI